MKSISKERERQRNRRQKRKSWAQVVLQNWLQGSPGQVRRARQCAEDQPGSQAHLALGLGPTPQLSHNRQESTEDGLIRQFIPKAVKVVQHLAEASLCEGQL